VAATNIRDGWCGLPLAPFREGMVNAPTTANFDPANYADGSAMQALTIAVRSSLEDHLMRTFRDAKAMARSLRDALAAKNIALPHSACLEIVAAQFGVDDWNVLSAKIEQAEPERVSTAAAPISGPDFKRTIPILRIFSIEKAMEFYIGFLGFKIDWEHRFGENFPVYMQVSRGNLLLHLSEHHGDASPGSTVFVWMRGIAAFHAELMAKDYRYNKPGLEDADWDGKLVQVSDPFGNRIRFTEPNKADDPRA
jgi:uncharacterized glyoxalase superfamily protein PhnB